MSIRFVDEAWINVYAGKGGDGCCSFRREKYVPRGGPDGGDGGRGGHVILFADPHVQTLLDFTGRPVHKAEKGRPGSSKNQTGRMGADLRISVPVGTMVYDEEGHMIVDLAESEQEFVIAKGGEGGRGNTGFATSTHQSPREFTPGEEGEERRVHLELKLIADVGLLGLPNAGKSTFLSRVSSAHPKIADYPFTTLSPQLGIAELDTFRRIVLADVPGLIEGAADGVGLGIGFLKHLERTRVMLHLLDPHDREIDELVHDHQVIRGEVGAHSTELADRPMITVINKSDLLPAEEVEKIRIELQERLNEPVMVISGVTGDGIRTVLEQLWRLLNPSE